MRFSSWLRFCDSPASTARATRGNRGNQRAPILYPALYFSSQQSLSRHETGRASVAPFRRSFMSATRCYSRSPTCSGEHSSSVPDSLFPAGRTAIAAAFSPLGGYSETFSPLQKCDIGTPGIRTQLIAFPPLIRRVMPDITGEPSSDEPTS